MTEPAENTSDRIAVVLVAAGRGQRMGEVRPKQYLDLGGAPVIRRTIDACLAVPEIATLLTVIRPADEAMYLDAIVGLSDRRLLPPVAGGETRSGSVRAGLEALADIGADRVLIHDAARPFVSPDIFRSVIAALDRTEGAFAALPVVDALWQVEDGRAGASMPREGLWRAQTPQGFHLGPILAAHRNAEGDSSDDVAVAREAGMTVAVVEGDEVNFKITSPTDLARARAMLES